MTDDHWNPNTPDAAGVEIGADLAAGSYITTEVVSDAWIQNYYSEDADTVSTVDLWMTLNDPGGSSWTNTGMGIVEVYEAADLPGTDFSGSWTDFEANEIVSSTNWSAAGSGATLIDEIDTLADDTEYASSTGGDGDNMVVRFNTSGASLSGRIQAAVRFRYESAGSSAEVFIGDGTDEYRFGTLPLSASIQTVELALPELNPFTELPWTEADIQSFDSTYEITVNPWLATSLDIYYMGIATRTVTEDRVAFGVFKWTAPTTAAVQSVTLQAPAGGNWSKAASTLYSVVVRNTGTAPAYSDSSGSGLLVQYVGFSMHSLHSPYEPGWSSHSLTLGTVAIQVLTSPFNTVTGIITAVGDADTYAPGVYGNYGWGLISFGSAAVDGQVYTRVREEGVSTSLDLAQEISAPQSATYDGCAVLARYADTPTADLTVEIRDSATIGGGSLFGTGSVSVSDFVEAAKYGTQSDWRLLIIDLTSTVALVSGTDYFIQFTSSSDDSAPWYIQALDTDPTGTGTGYPESSFGGAEGAYLDGVLRDDADVVAYAYVAPAAPTGVAAAAGVADLTVGWDGIEQINPMAGDPAGSPYVALSWTATAIGGTFTRYDIQRKDAIDTTWRTVAQITTEADADFDDYEARIGVESTYRIRAVDSLLPGKWSSEVSATPETVDSGLWLTANSDRTTVLFVQDMYRGRGGPQRFDSPEAQRVRTFPIHGRDYVVAFVPTERSGVSFKRDVLAGVITASDRTPGPGPGAYDTLRDLTVNSALTYICVRDQFGNRWFANVRVPQMGPWSTSPAGPTLLLADMEVVETTATPVAVSS